MDHLESEAVAPTGPVEDSSVEYLLERQCRIEAAGPASAPLKGDSEKGEGSDSGVEFGATAAVAARQTHRKESLDDNDEDYEEHNSRDNELSSRPPTTQELPDNERRPPNGDLHRHDVFAIATSTEGHFSCDSSVLSFCSEENLLDGVKTMSGSGGGGGVRGTDCASEGGGSESSSVYNHPVTVTTSSVKKRVNVIEGHNTMTRNMSVSTTQLSKADTLGRAKFRAVSVNRVGPPSLLTKDRARSKDRGSISSSGSPLVRANSVRRPPKPDSLPVSSPMAPPTKRLSTLTRAQSVRTPGSTPTDSGRWPFGPTSTMGGTPRSARVPGEVTVKTRLGQMSLADQQQQSNDKATFDKYATLPRRRTERSTDQKAASQESSTRSSSISRERQTTTTTSSSSRMSLSTNSTPITGTPKMRSVVRRLTQKVKIFQETSSQTALTSDDVENAFAGRVAAVVDVAKRDQRTLGTQSEIRDRELEELRKRVKHLTEEGEQLKSALGGKTILLASVEQQLAREKEQRLKLQKELQCNSERVVAILEAHSAMGSDGMMDSTDSLMMLETKVTSDSQAVQRQRQELKKMRNVCQALRMELDEALERERAMISERESEEMQEFLQIEKSVLTDAAKTEEKAKWQSVVEKKDQEIKWLLEECRHLVRFCEQRRQENLGMQAKYGALEIKSKELLAQQGTAVNGASVALNSLGSRLEQLVEQLIASYNISEQELEDVVFHNEAFPDTDSSNGNGSCMATPENDEAPREKSSHGGKKGGQDLSPQRSHSFINVVIYAIRNATSLKKDAGDSAEDKAKLVPKPIERIQEERVFGSRIEDGSDGSTDMLDSETEPCLMMENVLSTATGPATNRDASIAEEDDDDVLLENDEDHSLNNLSQAISNRQQIELQTSQMLSNSSAHSLAMFRKQASHEMSEDVSHASSLADDLMRCESCTSSQAIVEQVISVDNLITKLLKVLRIVQMDNDSCIQQLIGEKNKLQQKETETEDRLRDGEDVNQNLKCQLTTMTQQLLDTEEELNLSKMELQNCRQEIEKLNHHICELSTLCSNKENNNGTSTVTEYLDNGHPQTRGIEGALKAVLKTIDENVDTKRTDLPVQGEEELSGHIMSLLKSNRDLRAALTEQSRNPNMGWQLNAISDLKRLYEVIDGALEVLNATPQATEQYPVLGKLQQDLEETNFALATSLPSYMAIMGTLQKQQQQQQDQNANPTTTTLTLTNGDEVGPAAGGGGGGVSPAIDSVA